LLPALATRWQVYAIDYRDYGGSSLVPGGYRVVDYIEDARHFVRAVCPQPPVLLGHSLGGW
jgi:pimeloyl-ACP methyl ester carboxylesterase